VRIQKKIKNIVRQKMINPDFELINKINESSARDALSSEEWVRLFHAFPNWDKLVAEEGSDLKFDGKNMLMVRLARENRHFPAIYKAVVKQGKHFTWHELNSFAQELPYAEWILSFGKALDQTETQAFWKAYADEWLSEVMSLKPKQSLELVNFLLERGANPSQIIEGGRINSSTGPRYKRLPLVALAISEPIFDALLSKDPDVTEVIDGNTTAEWIEVFRMGGQHQVEGRGGAMAKKAMLRAQKQLESDPEKKRKAEQKMLWRVLETSKTWMPIQRVLSAIGPSAATFRGEQGESVLQYAAKVSPEFLKNMMSSKHLKSMDLLYKDDYGRGLVHYALMNRSPRPNIEGGYLEAVVWPTTSEEWFAFHEVFLVGSFYGAPIDVDFDENDPTFQLHPKVGYAQTVNERLFGKTIPIEYDYDAYFGQLLNKYGYNIIECMNDQVIMPSWLMPPGRYDGPEEHLAWLNKIKEEVNTTEAADAMLVLLYYTFARKAMGVRKFDAIEHKEEQDSFKAGIEYCLTIGASIQAFDKMSIPLKRDIKMIRQRAMEDHHIETVYPLIEGMWSIIEAGSLRGVQNQPTQKRKRTL
jgi:hypothetical protein